MQGSLFIAWGYLGVKRRKLGFIRRYSLENKQKVVDAGHRAHRYKRKAPEAAPHVWFLVFSFRFLSFFCYKTPRNLKWISFTLYYLQQLSKNPWSLILHPWSFTRCLDFMIYMIPHYKTLKTPMVLHDIG